MNTRKKEKYPSGRGGVYLSMTLATISVILAVLLLQNSLYHLIYYVFSTAAMTMFILALKIRFAASSTSIVIQESSKADLLQTGERTTSLKTLLAVLCVLLASFFIPLSLSWVLPADAWVILVISFTSSISFAELLFYLRMRQNGS